MREVDVVEFQVSPRHKLKVGSTFRTIHGYGPSFGSKSVGIFSKFRCMRLFKKGKRVYAAAQDLTSGGLHTIYLQGPSFKSRMGVREKPYRIALS